MVYPNKSGKFNNKRIMLDSTFDKLLYTLIRVKKPERVIETGVAYGYSSWIILNAIYKNRMGHLISIDLPNNDTNNDYNVGKITNIGMIVPSELKKHWTLKIGKSSELLEKIKNNWGEIDLFFHDSEHSYENMSYEFEYAHKILRRDGILMSDDIYKNSAFIEHVEKYKKNYILLNKGGIAYNTYA